MGLGNVLMVSNYRSDVGYAWWLMEHFWTTLAAECVRDGGSAYLAYPQITTLPPGITSAPLETVELRLPPESPAGSKALSEFIRAKRIKTVYLTDQPYFSSLYVWLRRQGVRKVLVHDHTPGDRPPIGGFRGVLKAIRNSLPWVTADRMLCVSPLMRDRNASNGRIPGRKLVVVQNGIRPSDCGSKEVADAVRASLGLRPETLIVVATGRAHPYKRFDFIIDCAAELIRSAPHLDIVFLLIGDGPSLGELEEQVKRLNLAGQVRLLGRRSDVPALLCASNVAMHAALGEGFSLSIVEYMSAGLPVLVPDIPSVCQAVKHGESGFVYPTRDVAKAASYLATLASDSVKREQMGRAAKHRADTEYTLDRCTREFLKAVDDVRRA